MGARRISPPYWGKVGNQFVADNSGPLGEQSWQYKLAPGIRAHVSRNIESGLCEYRVSGLGLLDVWRTVAGGPQMAANTARREVEKLCAMIRNA